MLKLQIITPERSLPTVEVAHVTMTTVDGEVGIRTGHAPLVAGLKTGFAMFRDEAGKETFLAVKAGSALVLKDEVRLYVEAAVSASLIDLDLVQKRLDTISKTVAKDAAHKAQLESEATWQLMQLSVSQRSAGESGQRKAV